MRFKKGREEITPLGKLTAKRRTATKELGRDQMPEGDYIAMAIEDKRKEDLNRFVSKAGNPCFFLSFCVLAPKLWKNWRIFHMQTYAPEGAWFFKEWIESMYDPKDRPIEVDFADDEQMHHLLLYRPVGITTVERYFAGERRLRVSSFFSVEDPIMLEKAWSDAEKLVEGGKVGGGPRI